jgi:hypothetical protein
MSKHNPTFLSIVDRALDDQGLTGRLQKLIVTLTCCLLSIFLLLLVVVALAGGFMAQTAGVGLAGFAAWWSIFRARRARLRRSDTYSGPGR